MDLLAAVSIGDWEMAERLVGENPKLVERGRANAGVLHLMAKRNSVAGVKWLLDHGADPNALWAHWDAKVTPLHMAAMQGHAKVARLLVDSGADPRIPDSKHDSDAIGWAEFFRHAEVLKMLTEHAAKLE
jgi:ankyrin repeat protein